MQVVTTPKQTLDVGLTALIQEHSLVEVLYSLADLIALENVTLSPEQSEIARTFVELAAEEITA
ncbi:MAG: hypothetical protein AAF921_10110 [Cyanobacteria bacterium P01_D01_bin.44]